MTVDRVLIITMALGIVTIILMIVGQALGHFDSVLKAVLRHPSDDADPEPVKFRLIAPFAVAAAIAALDLLILLLTRQYVRGSASQQLGSV